MITVQPPLDLPPYNEVVVIKVRLDNGHIKYRTDARDRPAFRREYRTFRYDDNGFLLLLLQSAIHAGGLPRVSARFAHLALGWWL